ncbi:hypothetical protein MMC07_001507 [Pseudocyphellaria aurata]|nr:hypothetical protein [Pseudocyphellaria aurata]
MAPQMPTDEITLKTRRLLLRRVRDEDVRDVFSLRSNPKVIFWKEPDTKESQSRDYLEFLRGEGRCWNFVVHLLPTESVRTSNDTSLEIPATSSKFIGICGGHWLPEVGYLFDPSVWGQGYATEALEGFIKAYWDTFPDGFPGLEGEEKDFLMAVTDEDNVGSVTVLKRNGFEFWKEKEENDKRTGENVTLTVRRVWRAGKG